MKMSPNNQHGKQIKSAFGINLSQKTMGIILLSPKLNKDNKTVVCLLILILFLFYPETNCTPTKYSTSPTQICNYFRTHTMYICTDMPN